MKKSENILTFLLFCKFLWNQFYSVVTLVMIAIKGDKGNQKVFPFDFQINQFHFLQIYLLLVMFNSLLILHCGSLIFSMLSEDHNFLSATQSFRTMLYLPTEVLLWYFGSHGWTFDPLFWFSHDVFVKGPIVFVYIC